MLQAKVESNAPAYPGYSRDGNQSGPSGSVTSGDSDNSQPVLAMRRFSRIMQKYADGFVEVSDAERKQDGKHNPDC